MHKAALSQGFTILGQGRRQCIEALTEHVASFTSLIGSFEMLKEKQWKGNL
jgi:hypothetical protein